MKDKSNNGKDSVFELKQINDELENYFRSTIIPQLFFDRDLILRKYSPAAVKQFNLSKKDIGKRLQSITNYLLYSSLVEDIEKTISSNNVLEKEIQTNDKKWYRMNLIPYYQREEKRTNGVIITFVDINSYVTSLKDLQEIIAGHEVFVHSISHDLKAPLNNIIGVVDVLKDSLKDGNTKEISKLMKMLESATFNMKEVISDLTKISHLKIDDAKIKLNFSELLDEVCLTIKKEIVDTKAVIKTDFTVEEINFSRKELRSLLYNLVSNAIKYRSKDRTPVVSIKTEKEDKYTVLSVTDNGRGIEEGKEEIIFNPFTRALDDVEGTGIGLYLISKIVKANGGKIVVNSKENEGSEFLIYLKG